MSFKPSNDTFISSKSINNRLLVEVYKKGELRSKISNGFASIDQKTTLKGLKVLVDAKLNDGSTILKNSTVYIKEDALHTQAWAQKSYECELVGQPFLVIDALHVEFVQPPKQEA